MTFLTKQSVFIVVVALLVLALTDASIARKNNLRGLLNRDYDSYHRQMPSKNGESKGNSDESKGTSKSKSDESKGKSKSKSNESSKSKKSESEKARAGDGEGKKSKTSKSESDKARAGDGEGKKSKSKKSEKSASSDDSEIDINLNSQSVFIAEGNVTEAPPPPPRPSLDDWMAGCLQENAAIDQCIVVTSGLSNGQNCKTCLKQLAMGANPPPVDPIPNGVKVCAGNGMCGQCDKSKILPFYGCGLALDQAHFASLLAGAEDATTTTTTTTATTTTTTTTTTEAEAEGAVAATEVEAIVDDKNCPAVWPGHGTTCYMFAPYNRKECIYHEYSADSICTCGVGDPNPDALLWKCLNGPQVLEVVAIAESPEEAVADLVEEEQEEQEPSDNTIGAAAAADSGNEDIINPLPVIGIDAEINSLP